MIPLDVHQLPAPVAAFIQAGNAGDPDAFIATFSDDALLNDEQREHLGRAAIAAWAAKFWFGASVTMSVTKAADHHGSIVLTAKMDGTYDKAGLPDPLLLTFYFTLAGERIVQLIILLNKKAG